MIGGIVTSTIMELLLFPAIYFIWRSPRIQRKPVSPTPQAQLV
jgi:Cu(I)/Ag(I) efflux system membrane protein CusA/SilA